MSPFPIFLVGIILAYSLLILLLAHGLRKLAAAGCQPLERTSGLSVLIPFRNEEDTLPALLEDLDKQTFPATDFEIILVDDHSMDRSAILAEEFAGGRSGCSLLRLTESKSGKKEALALGISRAEAPWILQLDADCRVGADFLRAHMAFVQSSGADLVAGAVLCSPGGGSFAENFERLDVLSLLAAEAGSFYFGRPLMCSGANLLYRKELHRETRLYDPAGTASGDDMFLLIGARKLGRKTAFNTDPLSFVLTPPQKNPRALIRQRMRWGAKSSRYRMPDIQLTALLVALASLAFVLIPVAVLLFPAALWPVLSAGAIKMLSDYILIRQMARKTSHEDALKAYLPVALLHPLYMLVVIGGMPFRGSGWK